MIYLKSKICHTFNKELGVMTKNKGHQTIFLYKTIIVAFNNSIIISALAIT